MHSPRLLIRVAVLALAAIAGNMIQHRLVWSSESLKPKFSKVSPGAGLKRIFGKQAIANFFKGLFKLIALGAVLLLGILQGILLAAAASILLLLARVSRPHVAFLGRVPGTNRYSDIARHPENEALPGVIAFRPEASVIYVNADAVREEVLSRLGASDIRMVVCDLSASPYIDLAGSRMLHELHRATGLVVHLAVLDGSDVFYLEKIGDRMSAAIPTRVGGRQPAHCTAVGKAMLSSLPTEQVEVMLRGSGLHRYTDSTITDPATLADRLEVVRDNGYAIDEGEKENGVRCVAVPVLGAPARMAMSISGPAPRMTDELVDRLSPKLLREAAAISALLGHRPSLS